MTGAETLKRIASELIEKNGINNYTLCIAYDISDTGVIGHRTIKNSTTDYYRFTIGHSDYSGYFNNVFNLVNKKYPLTKNINPFVVVTLHEIAHVLDFVNPIVPRGFYSTEEYREHPREKAADMFAERFIFDNPKLCEEFSKMADNAIEEIWNGQ